MLIHILPRYELRRDTPSQYPIDERVDTFDGTKNIGEILRNHLLGALELVICDDTAVGFESDIRKAGPPIGKPEQTNGWEVREIPYQSWHSWAVFS